MPINLIDIRNGDGSQGFVLRPGAWSFGESGWSVSSAGDMNGDGFDDVIVGAPGEIGSSGTSYVLFGKAGGFAASFELSALRGGDGTQGFAINGEEFNDKLGYSVSSAGDLNGDGYADIIVGAPGGNGVLNDTSAGAFSYVIFGKASGFPGSIELAGISFGDGSKGIAFGGDTATGSGPSVSSAGDVNGDGFDDVIIGYPQDEGDLPGVSYVVFGKAGGFAPYSSLELIRGGGGINGFAIDGERKQDQSGFSVASAGDMNGDGINDLIIGANFGDGPGDTRDAAGDSYVVFGRAGGFGGTLNLADITKGNGSEGFVLRGETAGDHSGISVSSAGDLNGDGFDDVVVGARDGDGPADGRQNAGDSYVVFGKAGGFAANLDLAAITSGDGSLGFVLHGAKAFDQSGCSVASAGDVNGDGIDDLIVGAFQGDNPDGILDNPGTAYVVFGKTGAFDAVLDLADIAAGDGSKGFVISGSASSDRAGFSVASAGDVNGDGFDDLVVGAPWVDTGVGLEFKFDAGNTYVIFGSATIGGSASHLTQPAGGDIGDTLTGAGGVADVLIGGRGDDKISGGGGADSLRGGEGDDILTISDTSFFHLDGGNGSDTLVISGNQTLVDSNFRRVSDMEAMTVSAQAVNLTLGRNASLAFGGVASSDFHVSIDTTAASTTAAQIINAAGFNHSLTLDFSKNTVGVRLGGGLRGDQLTGGSANDILNGGGGSDKLIGGVGNDTYYVTTGDLVTEAAGGGNDRVAVQSDFVLSSGQEIELLTTTDSTALRSIDITGNELAQTIVGNEGNNWLHDGGVGGADTLRGGGGSDLYTVYNSDAVIIEGKGQGDLDSLTAGVDYVLAQGMEIEKILTTSLHATDGVDLTGNEFGQAIIGNDGDNRIDGKGGSDAIEGAMGNDTLRGGAGNDTIHGDYGERLTDWPVGAPGSGVVTRPADVHIFDVSNAFSVAADPNIIDSTTVPHVTINAEGDDTRYLYRVDLTMAATLTLDIDNSVFLNSYIELKDSSLSVIASNTDSPITDGAGGSTTSDDSFLTFTVDAGTYYILVQNFQRKAVAPGETYQLHISAEAVLAAKANNDTLYGDNGDDTLWGGGGDDLLDGGSDADTMHGGTGNDVFIVDKAGDVVAEAAGEGTADRVSARVSYTLQAGSEIEMLTTTSFAGTTAIDLTGNEFAQSIVGNAGANILSGGGGDDVLNGSGGNDTLNGDDGNDAITGGDGNDTLEGDEGNDTIRGGDGSDTLEGGNGDDILIGGDGDDTYYVDTGDAVIEATGGGDDRVSARADFALAGGQEIELLTTANSNGTGSIDITGSKFAQTIIGNDGNNRLDDGGEGGIDTLVGRDGNDYYTIHNSAAVIVEAKGQGEFDRLATSVDYVLAQGVEIESLRTTSQHATYNLDLTGNEVGQEIIGNDGINRIDGKAGNDTIEGALGNDTLHGGAGNDTIYGELTPAWTVGVLGSGSIAKPQGNDFIDLDTGFNLAFNSDIVDSTMVPHVTVEAAGNGQYHTYMFTLSAGTTLTVDIDNTTGGLDSYIRLSRPNLEVINDDSLPTQGAGGSASNLDSFLTYTVNESGSYFITVMQAKGLVPVALGQNYRLHVSAAEIPPAGSESSNDNLFGDGGNDSLWGGGGDDVLDGGADADVMRGGSGKDFFVFSTVLGAANVDSILDFNVADDTMRLDHTIFTALGVGALTASAFKDNALAPRDADDHIIYNSDTGSLFYDADGLGGAAAVKFASLLPGLALTAADFVVT